MIPVICTFGMGGFGKTTLVRKLVAERQWLLAWDPDREHDVLHLSYHDFSAYLDRHAATATSLRVGLTDDEEYAEDLCAFAWELCQDLHARQQSLTVLLEEADEVAPSNFQLPIVRRLIRRARHYGAEVIMCSRRPADVSRRLTSQASEMYLFGTQEPKDVRYLTEFIGPDAAAAVGALPKFHYVHWRRGGGWERHAPDS